ncbi:MAG TPA: ABC transporter ATP-binding protein [Pseudogracilibacillus sp.]|nr:ABC transporter ATP-binding protein [Pseudogracilibacillus sp.]
MKIELKNISKKYKDKRVLHQVSLQMNEPKIYALLGRNGAGKTTLMNIIAGHLLPTSGDYTINGVDPFDNREVLKHICLIKETNNFHRDMKVKDVLKSYANLYENWNSQLVAELLDIYKLPLKARVKTLSKGMESALGVIVGLASRAKITIFDEPYIGMDAAARQKFYDILLDVYEEEERIIIFSTHLIDEASLLFEEIFIIKDGEIILQEEAESIRSNAHSVTGTTKDVKAYIADKNVLATKQLANLMTAYLYGEQRNIPETLEVEGIPIQDVMIYLTEIEGEINAKGY